jgi:hypothetical protein
LDDAPNETKRPIAKCELGSVRRAEQIRDQPEVGPGDVGEKKSGTAGRDDAAVNLGHLEMWIDPRLHRDEVIVTAKLVDEGA